MKERKITIAFFVMLFIVSFIIVFVRNRYLEQEKSKIENEANIMFAENEPDTQDEIDEEEREIIANNTIVRKNYNTKYKCRCSDT